VPDDVPLTGGHVSAGVVRVGDTVRKPTTSATPSVDHLLSYLAERGFEGSPRPLGRDDRGRQVLEYVAGELAHDLPALDLDGLFRVGRLIRSLHDLTQGYVPPPGRGGTSCSAPTARSWCATATSRRGTW
jgi:hypothetical protein